MADTVTPKRRSEIMSNIRAKGMKPEMALRRITHAMGYRGFVKLTAFTPKSR